MESFSFFPYKSAIFRLFISFVSCTCLSLGAGRRPSQGSASVFCYYYLCLLCSKFPARLQSLNSVTKPEMNISRQKI